MTIKRNVQLPRSSKKGAKPKASELEYGNLAVNFTAGDEFLSTKNSKNEVVIFPSENYFTSHPLSNLTLDNLTVNNGASINGNTKINGDLNVSGTTRTKGPNYFDGETYVKSGTTFMKIADFVNGTAHADGNDFVTGGSASNNTLKLTGKGTAGATINGVATTDKIPELVSQNSLTYTIAKDGKTVTLKDNKGVSHGSFTDAKSHIQAITLKGSVVAPDTNKNVNLGNLVKANDTLWEKGSSQGSVKIKNPSVNSSGTYSVA